MTIKPTILQLLGAPQSLEEFMWLRSVVATFLLSASVMAASHRPVCPGPAAFGTGRCHASVVTDTRGVPAAAVTPSGYGPIQFRTAYGLPASASVVKTIAIVRPSCMHDGEWLLQESEPDGWNQLSANQRGLGP